jgi:hypothetical protein
MKKTEILRKALAIITSTLVLAGLISVDAQAASPAKGGSCTKLGSIQGLPNHQFRCVKSGKKLVWQAIPATAKPTPSVTATPSANPTPSATATTAASKFTAKIPMSLPVSQNGAITFANAASNFAKIPEQAYANVQAAIAAGSEGPINVSVSIGPTTNTTQDVILNGIKRELKLFSGFTIPTKLQAIAYNAADTAWAEAEWTNVASKYPFTNNPKNYLPLVTQSCEMSGKTPVNCGGGMAFMVPGSDAKFIFYGVENGNFWTPNPPDYQTATQVNHEMTHAIQFAQFEGVKMHAGDNVITDTAHRAYPCWLSEGQANALGLSIFIPNFNSYSEVRDRTVTNLINPGQQNPFPDYSAASFTNFLTNQEPFTGPNSPGCYQPGTGMYQAGYSVGFAATEALIAIGGPQATMALIAKGAEGATWSEAFKAVYGISWAEGAEVLGKVLAAEYSAKPVRR